MPSSVFASATLCCLLLLGCPSDDAPPDDAEDGGNARTDAGNDDGTLDWLIGGEWARQVGSTGNDETAGCGVDASESVVVAGRSDTELPGVMKSGFDNDAFLIKYDASGQLEWLQQVGTVGDDYFTDIGVDLDGNIFVAGLWNGTLPEDPTPREDMTFVRKYGPDGEELWTRSLGSGRAGVWDVAISTDAEGNVVIAGSMRAEDDNGESVDVGLVRKYSAQGDELWSEQIVAEPSVHYPVTMTTRPRARALAVSVHGDVVAVAGAVEGLLAGQSESTEQGDVFVITYDAGGSRQWATQFGTPGAEAPTAIAVNDDGHVAVAGYTTDAIDPDLIIETERHAPFVRVYGDSGTELWTDQMDPGTAQALDFADDGTLWLAGNSLGDFEDEHGIEPTPYESVNVASDTFIRGYDDTGDALHTRLIGSTGYEHTACVHVLDAGRLLVAGWTDNSFPTNMTASGPDVFVTSLLAPTAE